MKIFVGFDRREVTAWRVCVESLRATSPAVLDIAPISAPMLRKDGLYTRPESLRDGRHYDDISDAPMSTEFAIARFFVPRLVSSGWALFCDGDFLWRADVAGLFALADERCAVMVVKHDHRPTESVKMDGQAQTQYPRKNWSSLMLLNCGHPAVKALTLAQLNTLPGRDLHAFTWLKDELIGALPAEWNWLEGSPKAVHFTRGTPDMPGYETSAYADEWQAYACR